VLSLILVPYYVGLNFINDFRSSNYNLTSFFKMIAQMWLVHFFSIVTNGIRAT
jgi:hypothetical protein